MAEAREAKRAKRESVGSGSDESHDNSAETLPESSVSDPSELSGISTDDPTETSGASLSSPSESVSDKNPEFNLEEATCIYANEWVESLHRDSLQSVSMLLWYLLGGVLRYPIMDAAKLIGEVLGKGERTIREWRAKFIDNRGKFPESLQGKYQRQGVLWQSEDLNKKAAKHVRESSVVKGRPNMTAGAFCRWVNEDLLQNVSLAPGYPRQISLETARKWLHHLGFEVLDHKKGTYCDGHERDDVVEYRGKFIRKMIALGFLNKDNAPTPEAAASLPTDLESPSADKISKTVVIFHDESTFQANDDQRTFWGTKDMQILKPKSRGAGIMVSDFIEEHNGYLRLTDEEFEEAKKSNPRLKKQARAFLEYGENKEGYWTSEKFMSQIDDAATIAETKYPREKGYRLVWIFDHSSCHGAYAENALNANKMNAKPGGKQPVMRDTINPFTGQVQHLVFSIGIPKGLIQVLKERGIDTRKMKLDDMRKELASHSDFRDEKTKIEHELNRRGHVCILLPKFHCELNPIERCWAQAKRYTRAYSNHTINGLRRNVPNGLEVVTLENIQNHYRKVRTYMFGYVQGFAAGKELEEYMKKCKKIYKSHRRVGTDE